MSPSQGIHLVFAREFLPGDSAIMVPHTRDGRVMFAIPWLGHTLVGTTDTPIDAPVREPRAREEEIAFLLETAAQYLDHAPTRDDILSVWGGIRPLVGAGIGSTAALSRDHAIHIDPNGLLTISGGKWTTYRRMAEDCVNQAAMVAGLTERDCVTATLAIEPHPEFETWMTRRVDDVLARRRRTLFLDAKRAMDEAPDVARTLRAGGEQVAEFRALARGYLPE
jgi:glycerol-3-phosphate dehydrogenase